MVSFLAVQIVLYLFQSYILLGEVRGLAENGFITEKFPVFNNEYMKDVQQEIKHLGIKIRGKWKVVCEGENLSLTCNADEVIKIMDAEYGRNDGTTCSSYPNFNNSQCLSHENALYRVKQRCHNKRRCNMKSSSDEFGDPCPNMIKYLEVKYVCEPRRSSIRESATLCEGENQQINCQKGTSIMITDTFYGRNDRITCCCHLMNDTNCMATNALDLISARCDYKESCTLEAVNQVFGDPCIGTIKYLEVNYLCLPDKVHHVRNCEGTEIKIGCEKSLFIDVIDAHYGRAHPFVCLNDTTPFLKLGCGSKDITSSVKERCQGKSWCAFPASNEIFGDPCFGYTKHLDVEYSCNG
ncbi:unnamed protein product, partial [Nezara viridula]